MNRQLVLKTSENTTFGDDSNSFIFHEPATSVSYLIGAFYTGPYCRYFWAFGVISAGCHRKKVLPEKILPSTYFPDISTPKYLFPRIKVLPGVHFS